MNNQNIGIDIGYGFTKSYDGVGTKIFPTAITRVVPAATFGDLKTMIVNGEKFLVGEDAIREGKGLIDTRTTAFVGSNAWLATLCYALDAHRYLPNRGGVIVLGVPPGQYNRRVVSEMVETVKNSSIFYGVRYVFEKNIISVIPQGAGIFFLYVSHHPADFKKDIAVIDIGHYTIDMILFSDGKYVEGAARSIPIGVSMILDDIIRAFYNKYGFTIQHKEAYKLLTEGSVTILEDSYVLADINSIVTAYAMQISSLIDGFFENLPAKPEIGLAGGGGVLCLKGAVRLKYKLHIVHSPEVANAIGYWHYARDIGAAT